MVKRFFKALFWAALWTIVMTLLNNDQNIVKSAALVGSVMLPVYLAGETVIWQFRSWLESPRYRSKISAWPKGELIAVGVVMFIISFLAYILIYWVVFVRMLHLL